MDARTRITALLEKEGANRIDLYEQLMPLVYDELKRLAHHHLREERAGHTLNTTALVHEAYFRLVGQDSPWENRGHFFAVASMAMRRILVNHARDRARLKRGGGAPRLSLDEVRDVAADERPLDIVALDEALGRLEQINERAVRIVECRYFGGLTIEETAGVLEISPTTVKHQWRVAKAWLKSEIAS